jgi:predicted nucleic acid-binding protein
VGVSVLTLFEVWTTYLYRTDSVSRADKAVADLRKAVGEVVPVNEAVLDLAFELRRTATARIALAYCLIAATAAHHQSIPVHRDSHFAALPEGRPKQETLPDKLPPPQSF